MLGRCRRDVVVFDSGKPRNAASQALHGFLTRDGVSPTELRRLGRAELVNYPSVQCCDRKVIAVERGTGRARFMVHTEDGDGVPTRALLLATGRDDVLPERPGFAELYGRGVYHCPFCDGWEHRDQPLAAYGRDEEAFEVALELLTWSPHVMLCTDGACQLKERERHALAAAGIALIETQLAALVADAERRLEALRLSSGETLPCRALFFVAGSPQKSALPEKLGCSLDPTGGVICQGHAATGVPGLFVAGNVRGGLHFAITAAAEGAEAAVAINDMLLEEDLRARS